MLDSNVIILLAVIVQSWLMLFAMISAKQTVRLSAQTVLSFGAFETVLSNNAVVYLNGWHIKTEHQITITTALVGAPASIAVLGSPMPRGNTVGSNTDGVMEMGTVSDNSGAGGIVSAMAPVMPSYVFLDVDMAAGTVFTVIKRHKVQINKTDVLEFRWNVNKMGGTITNGVITVKSVATILVGAMYGSNDRDPGGADVLIFITDQTTNKHGAWIPFCNGRMGAIRVSVYQVAGLFEETLIFGPDATPQELFPDESGEFQTSPGGDTIYVMGTPQSEEDFSYVTNFTSEKWDVKLGEAVPWFMDNSEGAEYRFVIEFHFVPGYNAKVIIPYNFESIEIGTPDLEEWKILPFDMFIESLDISISAVGTVLGIILWQTHLFKKDGPILPRFTSSEAVLDGSILGAHSTNIGVEAATVVDNLRIPIFPREVSADVFGAAEVAESHPEIYDYYIQGSAIGIYAEAVDATTISFLEGQTLLHARSRVNTKRFGSNYLFGEAVHNMEARS